MNGAIEADQMVCMTRVDIARLATPCLTHNLLELIVIFLLAFLSMQCYAKVLASHDSSLPITD